MVPLLVMLMAHLLELMMPMMPQLMMPMVPLLKDLLIMMTMVQMFLLMLMLLQKPLYLLMSRQDVPVLVVDLAALAVPLPSRITAMDVPRTLAAPTGGPRQESRHPELDVRSRLPDLLQGDSLKNRGVDVD